MNVTVIGKREFKGVSKKSGNDYHFYAAYYVGKESGVLGECGQQINLDPAFCAFEDIQVGSTYSVEFGPRGSVIGWAKVK